MVPVGGQVDAVAGRLSDVGFDIHQQTHGRRDVRTGHEDIGPVFRVVLRGDLEFVKESQFDSQVHLLGDFPGDLVVAVAVDGDTVLGVIVVLTP